MTDTRIEKVTAGSYRVAGWLVFRNGREWLVSAPGVADEVFSSFREAVTAALIKSL